MRLDKKGGELGVWIKSRAIDDGHDSFLLIIALQLASIDFDLDP